MFAADLVDNEDSPAFTAGFSDDDKLGYGFTSADVNPNPNLPSPLRSMVNAGNSSSPVKLMVNTKK